MANQSTDCSRSDDGFILLHICSRSIRIYRTKHSNKTLRNDTKINLHQILIDITVSIVEYMRTLVLVQLA